LILAPSIFWAIYSYSRRLQELIPVEPGFD
jgi:hypothetical protein